MRRRCEVGSITFRRHSVTQSFPHLSSISIVFCAYNSHFGWSEWGTTCYSCWQYSWLSMRTVSVFANTESINRNCLWMHLVRGSEAKVKSRVRWASKASVSFDVWRTWMPNASACGTSGSWCEYLATNKPNKSTCKWDKVEVFLIFRHNLTRIHTSSQWKKENLTQQTHTHTHQNIRMQFRLFHLHGIGENNTMISAKRNSVRFSANTEK